MGKKFLACLVMLVALQAVAWALGQQTDFSADMVTETGGQQIASKMYASKDKTRMEMQGHVTIARMDKNVMWILMPEENIYMEQPVDPMMMAQAPQEGSDFQRKSLGKETVDGEVAEKFEVTATHGQDRQSFYQWMRPNELPAKVAAVDGSWSVSYKNVSPGAQNPDLFEIPAGYQKFSAPAMPSMEGMKEMMQAAEDTAEQSE